MGNIATVDKNFAVKSSLQKEDVKFYNVLQYPFRLYGIFYENGRFRRLPEKIAKEVSEGVFSLHTNTAGGRVRFQTNSPYVAILTKMEAVGKMPHITLTGSAGFDLYVGGKCGEEYGGTFIPPYDMEHGFEGVIEFGSKTKRTVTIYFPLYSNVKELYVGISEQAFLKEAAPYKKEKPIVYYGSSITQGGCASRPGNTYQSMIARRLDCDYINLGFSGNAKGEKKMADYIKSLDMSVFVYDYDHNAPTARHLYYTHEHMFCEIRREKPKLPVVILSRPKFFLEDYEKERLQIIQKTYKHAISNGDRNVYFIPGNKLMRLAKYDGTVDNTHPNDLGFASMAQVLGDLLENIMEAEI